MSELNREALVAEAEKVNSQIKAAQKALGEAIDRQWLRQPALRMSIPANPERDTDLVIGEALRLSLAEIQRLSLLHEVQELEKSYVGAMEAMSAMENDRDRLKAEVERLTRCTVEWDEQQRNLCRFEFNRAEQAEAEVTRMTARWEALKSKSDEWTQRIMDELEAQR